MSIQIGLARTAADLDAVFRLRHDVFVREGIFEANWSGRIVDRFDAVPGVVNVIARVGDEIIGSIRFMENSTQGGSADDWFDFTPCLPEEGKLGSSSQLVVQEGLRDVPGLIFSMIAMGYGWCMQQGITHLTGAINPQIAEFCRRSGWEMVAEEFEHPGRKVPVQPGILKLDNLNSRFQTFIEKQHIEHVFHSFERALYSDDVLVEVSRSIVAASRLSLVFQTPP